MATKLFSKIASWFSSTQQQSSRSISLDRKSRLHATYDAAQTVSENSKHWSRADLLDADSSNSYGVRSTLRQRSRYECQKNNSYAKGLVLTLANDLIGTGPRLQLSTRNKNLNGLIESQFARWSKAVRLAEKLRTMRMAKIVDGEAFAILTTNQRVEYPVQLDLKLIEADQVSTPFLNPANALEIDGIKLDQDGNAIQFNVLKSHPGSTTMGGFGLESTPIPAEQMIHLFRCDRPGQHRGVPETTSALPLFALLRRFTLATVAAAETAADFAAIMKATSPALSAEDIEDGEAFDEIELVRRAMLTLPKGWDISQLKAEHPATTYPMFVDMILREVGRCLQVPFNKVSGSSKDYNFASGKLDSHDYYTSIDVERSQWESVALDRIFVAWFEEAQLVEGLFTPQVRQIDPRNLNRQWFWDTNNPAIDPVKEANAQATRLSSGTDTLPAIYARSGKDHEVELQKQAEALGVTIEELQALIVGSIFGKSGNAENVPAEETEATAA